MRHVLAVYLMSIFIGLQAAVASGTLAISPLRNSGDGCGCTFKSKADKSVYARSELGEFGTSDSMMINIDGKDIPLQKKVSDFPDSKRNPSKAEPKKGERLKEHFEGSGVYATLNYVYKGRCTDHPGFADKDSCSYSSYDVELKVRRGNDKAAVRLLCNCGC